MKLINLLAVTCVTLLSGCATSINDLGNGNFSTFGHGVSGASKNSAINKATEFCSAQKKVPFTKEDFRDRDGNYRMNFSCEDKQTAQRLEVQKLEAERKAESDRIKAENDRRAVIAREYPFEAVVACRFGTNSPAPLSMCIVSGRQDANFFVINGGTNRTGTTVSALPGAYKLTWLDANRLDGGNGVHILLKNSYTINVPNLSRDYVIELTIKRTDTGAIVERKTAGHLQTASSTR